MRLVVAGGGTGGHLFPGVAVAEAWLARGAPGERTVGFVGTDHGIEARVIPRLGHELKTIRAVGLVGRGWRGALAFAAALPAGLLGSWRALAAMHPAVVLGVGGYASFPVVAAALVRRVPTAIQEQNVIPGRANALLGKLVKKVFLSFPESARFFPSGKIVLTGNPVRREIAAAAVPETGRTRETACERPFTVLIFGGSQGAHAINRVAVEALAHLADLQGSLRFVHQTGEKDLEDVRRAYERAGVSAEVRPFIEDMTAAYQQADLVVCRAGAATLAELAAMGKPSILIPFPFAAAGHQERNARSFEERGAAQLILESKLDPADLAFRMRSLMADPARLREMGRKARELGRPGAAEAIVEELERLAAVWERGARVQA